MKVCVVVMMACQVVIEGNQMVMRVCEVLMLLMVMMVMMMMVMMMMVMMMI